MKAKAIQKSALWAVFLSLVCMMPLLASAHESHIYEINGVEYEFVIGSLGEPVIVDDKTGVDFELLREGRFVSGAQDMLQVEIIAGDARKTFNFSPVYGQEGRYRTTFFPTIATTLQYRVFGEIDGTPIDFTYTCNPVGHPQTEVDETRRDLGNGIVQTYSGGAFGCPEEKAAYGFPEESTSLVALKEETTQSENMSTGDSEGNTAVALSLVALALSIVALVRSRRKDTIN